MIETQCGLSHLRTGDLRPARVTTARTVQPSTPQFDPPHYNTWRAVEASQRENRLDDTNALEISPQVPTLVQPTPAQPSEPTREFPWRTYFRLPNWIKNIRDAREHARNHHQQVTEDMVSAGYPAVIWGKITKVVPPTFEQQTTQIDASTKDHPRETAELPLVHGRRYIVERSGDVTGPISQAERNALIDYILTYGGEKALREGSVEVELTQADIARSARTVDLSTIRKAPERKSRTPQTQKSAGNRQRNPLLDPSYDIYYHPVASTPRPHMA